MIQLNAEKINFVSGNFARLRISHLKVNNYFRRRNEVRSVVKPTAATMNELTSLLRPELIANGRPSGAMAAAAAPELKLIIHRKLRRIERWRSEISANRSMSFPIQVLAPASSGHYAAIRSIFFGKHTKNIPSFVCRDGRCDVLSRV